ncbi:MAG: exodeoxyribonuclease III [Rhodospirillales bacterium]
MAAAKTIRIATWNVNSVKARLPRVTEYLSEAAPDVVLLQELKCVDDAFPRMEIEDLGYNIAVHGQKTYNGVAILSKHPLDVDQIGLPGDEGDEQARYIEGFTAGVRVCALYLPNGNPTEGGESQKFLYKLGWMDRLTARAKALLALEEPFVMGGDYNICPTDDDVYDAEGFAGDALCRPESRGRYRELCSLGLTDAFRTFNPHPHVYSYWDYSGGAWQKDHGLRIDHLLLSPQAADKLEGAGIDRGPRGKEKPSDHTPVWCDLRAE